MMEYLFGFSTVGLGITAIVLAVRNGGLRAEIADADNARDQANGELEGLAANFNDYRNRTEVRLKSFVVELEVMDEQLADCTDPAVVRDRFTKLLSASRNTRNERQD